ncbi:MAG: ATP-binding protein [Egibacteraceae bacterium]
MVQVVEYLRRVIDDELDVLLEELAAVALEGPRGAGKTESALRRARTRVNLDEPAAAEVFAADPIGFLDMAQAPVLVDEWQRVPSSWDAVRRLVDADPRRAGRFLLTGSASPLQPPAHSGAGRIVTVRMRPMTLPERGVTSPTVSLAALLTGDRPPVAGTSAMDLAGYATEIAASGFPAIRATTGRARRAQIDSYLRLLVDRDLPEQGRRPRGTEATLLAWLRAVAAQTATVISWEKIRDAASPGRDDKPARGTTRVWEDALAAMWLLDPVSAWLPGKGHLRRLTASPKLHLADPALALRLLGFDESMLLAGRSPTVRPRDGTLFANLFESLVALSARVFAQAAEAAVGHLRTAGGEHEVDLIIERLDGRVIAVEVKLSAAVSDDDLRHLRWLGDRIGDDLLDAIVVTTGAHAYRRPDGIAVVPAALLGP